MYVCICVYSYMWINMEFGNAVYTRYLTLPYGTDMLSVNWTAIPLKQDNRTLWKIPKQLTKFYTGWAGSKPLVHCYWENHGRLRIGIDHHCKIPNWKNIVIVLVVVSKIFYLQMGWNEWVETTNIPRTTIVIHGIFNIYQYIFIGHLLFPWFQATLPNHQPSLPEGAAAAAPVAAPVPETTEAEIYVYLEIALEAIGMSWKISEEFEGY